MHVMSTLERGDLGKYNTKKGKVILFCDKRTCQKLATLVHVHTASVTGMAGPPRTVSRAWSRSLSVWAVPCSANGYSTQRITESREPVANVQ